MEKCTCHKPKSYEKLTCCMLCNVQNPHATIQNKGSKMGCECHFMVTKTVTLQEFLNCKVNTEEAAHSHTKLNMCRLANANRKAALKRHSL